MKRILILVMTICIVITTNACQKKQTRNQSLDNFEKYETIIYKLAEKYDVSVKPYFDINFTPECLYKEYILSLNEHSEIIIVFSNSAIETQYGIECFDVTYIKRNVGLRNHLNIELFIDICNAFSGYTITKETINAFLNAPEEEYSVTNYGNTKPDNAQISKMYILDFYENWVLSYSLTYENTEILLFSGPTK